MLFLMVIGGSLLLGAPFLARAIVGRRGDPVGAMRIIQVVALLLLFGALLVRPHNEETAAFPPPPDAPLDSAR